MESIEFSTNSFTLFSIHVRIGPYAHCLYPRLAGAIPRRPTDVPSPRHKAVAETSLHRCGEYVPDDEQVLHRLISAIYLFPAILHL